MRLVVDALLVVTVVMCWLAVIGFARLPTILERVHCVAFVNVAAGAVLCAAAFCADGVSDRTLKIVMILVVNVGSGAVVSHMTGRAVTQREAAP